VDEAPRGKDWLHEIKYDGYCMRTACGANIVLVPPLVSRIGQTGARERRTVVVRR